MYLGSYQARANLSLEEIEKTDIAFIFCFILLWLGLETYSSVLQEDFCHLHSALQHAVHK
jgi:hypothetical protein